MQNAEVESRARLDKVREEIRAAEDERDRKSKLTIADAERKAAAVLTAAHDDAGKILNDARAEAAKLLAPAQTQLAKLRGETETAVAEHGKASASLSAKQSDLVAISQKLEKLSSLHRDFQNHDALVEEIGRQEQRLGDLNAAIEKLKAQFGA
jgi:vacuolar-type H+-ATPase subunit H